MKCVLMLVVPLLVSCAITVKPIPVGKPKVIHHTRTKVVKVHDKSKPSQTPSPLSALPPFPPPNMDEIIRRTHPTPTISPFDFQ